MQRERLTGDSVKLPPGHMQISDEERRLKLVDMTKAWVLGAGSCRPGLPSLAKGHTVNRSWVGGCSWVSTPQAAPSSSRGLFPFLLPFPSSHLSTAQPPGPDPSSALLCSPPLHMTQNDFPGLLGLHGMLGCLIRIFLLP